MPEIKYGVSDKHTGPWIGEEDRPDMALAKGRAMWGTIRLYVAQIRPVKPSDGLPKLTTMVGDVRENLVSKYGSGADDFFDNPKIAIVLDSVDFRARVEFDRLIESVADIDFMVSAKVVGYGGSQHVRVNDFKDKTTP